MGFSESIIVTEITMYMLSSKSHRKIFSVRFVCVHAELFISYLFTINSSLLHIISAFTIIHLHSFGRNNFAHLFGLQKNKLKNSIIGKSLYTFFDILGVKNCKSKDDPQYKKKFRNEMGVSNLALKILIIRLHASLLQPCKFLVFLVVVVVFVKLWNHKILASWHFLPTMIIH